MPPPMSTSPARARSRSAARLAAVQALYQQDMEGTATARLLHEFHDHRLGATIDAEADGQASANADADDLNNVDDEDGVLITSDLIVGLAATLNVTASVAGLKAGASGHPYAASKAGVISLVQTTAYSLSGTGVRINAVCPGLIETGMTKPIFDNAKQRGTDGKIGQLNPLKRAGQPHELAAMGLFLASDDASYVNGQAIPVDGGLTASMPYAGKPI